MICKSSYELFRNLRDLREDSHNCQNWKTIVKIVEHFFNTFEISWVPRGTIVSLSLSKDSILYLILFGWL